MTPQSTQPLITVVILSHQRLDALLQCLLAVKASSYPSLEILVVDNLSQDSPSIRETLKRDHRDVRLFELSDNRGFALGMNTGIDAAMGQYCVLLADDIVLHPTAIARWVEHLVAHPQTALITGTLRQPNGSVRCQGGELSLGGVFKLRLHETGGEVPFPVNFAPGGFLLAHTAWLRETGGFRKDFYMYMEDVELSLRAQRDGWQIWCVPGAGAKDLESPHNYAQNQINVQALRNLFCIYALHAKWTVMLEFYFRYILLGLLKALPSPTRLVQQVVATGRFFGAIPQLLKARVATRHPPETFLSAHDTQGAA